MDVNNDVQMTDRSERTNMDPLSAKASEANDITDNAPDIKKEVFIEEVETKPYTLKSRIRVTVLIAFGAALAVIISVAIIVTVQNVYADDVVTPTSMPDVDTEVGEPLFLTPYIERGDFEEARNRSRVHWPDSPHTEVYAGFVTVNSTFNSNLHFAFLPSQVDPKKAPLVLYLNGGPGSSSLHCLFVCSGPVKLDGSGKLTPVNVSWNQNFSVIYLDQPVGTGFSFTQHEDGYAKDQNDIARNIGRFFEQFFKLFPYNRNPFYLAGESYAGKYIPAVGHLIHTEYYDWINLQGMFISAGYCDPGVMVAEYADFIFYVGMFTEKERDYFRNQTDEMRRLIQLERYAEAFEINDRILLGSQELNTTYFFNQTGSSSRNDYRWTKATDYSYIDKYMNSTRTRKAFFAGNLTLHDGTDVFKNMRNDVMKSVRPWVTTLLDNDYKMMFLSGQFDLLVNVAMTERFLMEVNWKGLPDYKTADKVVWRVSPDEEPAGYVRKAKNLFQVLVRGAGHDVFEQQRERVFDLLHRFINDIPFS